MKAIIDAWVERHDPVIRLLDADTGRELQRWGLDRVRTLLDEGLELTERLGGEL